MIHRNVKIFIAVAVALVIGLVVIANKAASTQVSALEQDTKLVKTLLAKIPKHMEEALQAANNPAKSDNIFNEGEVGGKRAVPDSDPK